MTIKKYEAIGLTQFSTFVIVKGKRIDLEFTPGIHYYNKYASYTAKDEDIQKALEATQMFKSGRRRVVSTTERLEPPKEVKIIKENKSEEAPVEKENNGGVFENLKELQVYLMKTHKISFAEIRSRENALAKANELGLEVTINN